MKIGSTSVVWSGSDPRGRPAEISSRIHYLREHSRDTNHHIALYRERIRMTDQEQWRRVLRPRAPDVSLEAHVEKTLAVCAALQVLKHRQKRNLDKLIDKQLDLEAEMNQQRERLREAREEARKRDQEAKKESQRRRERNNQSRARNVGKKRTKDERRGRDDADREIDRDFF